MRTWLIRITTRTHNINNYSSKFKILKRKKKWINKVSMIQYKTFNIGTSKREMKKTKLQKSLNKSKKKIKL